MQSLLKDFPGQFQKHLMLHPRVKVFSWSFFLTEWRVWPTTSCDPMGFLIPVHLGRGGSLLVILNYLPDGGHFFSSTNVMSDTGQFQIPGTCQAHEWNFSEVNNSLFLFFFLVEKRPSKQRNEYLCSSQYKMTFIPIFPNCLKKAFKTEKWVLG